MSQAGGSQHTRWKCNRLSRCGVSYLLLPFILEAQARRSFLKTLAVVRPGLVRFQLHYCGFQISSALLEDRNQQKKKNKLSAQFVSKELTAVPTHRRLPLHPRSKMICHQLGDEVYMQEMSQSYNPVIQLTLQNEKIKNTPVKKR